MKTKEQLLKFIPTCVHYEVLTIQEWEAKWNYRPVKAMHRVVKSIELAVATTDISIIRNSIAQAESDLVIHQYSGWSGVWKLAEQKYNECLAKTA